MRGDDTSFAQIRLYYLVYVCDHHFSIAYGRPPLTRCCDAIVMAKKILSLPQATEDDARLVSQVEIWSIASTVFETFGFDVETPVQPSLIPRMRRFGIQLDTWRADWNDQFGLHVHVGDYPRKGVKLHLDFAKLYLCSHAFRGLAPGPARRQGDFRSAGGETPVETGSQTSSSLKRRGTEALEGATEYRLHPDLEEISTAAVHAAQNILCTIVSDTEIQAHLNGLPLYFDTMMAFAIVFLFKIATKYSHFVRIDARETLGLISDVATALRTVTAKMNHQHLLVTVAKAVERLLSTQKLSGDYLSVRTQVGAGDSAVPDLAPSVRQPFPLDQQANMASLEMTNEHWDVGANFDWMTYDFLASENTCMESEVRGMGE